MDGETSFPIQQIRTQFLNFPAAERQRERERERDRERQRDRETERQREKGNPTFNSILQIHKHLSNFVFYTKIKREKKKEINRKDKGDTER